MDYQTLSVPPNTHYDYPLKGMLVDYWVDPKHTVGNELSGQLTGMVMSDGSYNRNSNCVLVCPLLGFGQLPNSGQAIPHPNGKAVFRPDISTIVGINSMEPHRRDGKAIIFAEDFVKSIYTRLLDFIKPVVAENASRQFIGKGMIGWFDSIPFPDNPHIQTPAPAVSLSPLAAAEQTGIAIVCRAFTDFLVYREDRCTAILYARGFKPNYLRSNSIIAVSIKRLQKGPAAPPVGLLRLTMAELFEKFQTLDDHEARKQIKAKYPGNKGDLSPAIQRALADWERMNKGRKLYKEFRI